MTFNSSSLINQSESVHAQVIEKNHFPAFKNRATVQPMRNDFWLMCMAAALAMATLAPVMVLAA
jgi:hypothetical protein